MNSYECIRALELASKANVAVCIAGPSGVGKTSITYQYAAQQGEGFCYAVLNAATANLADTTGFLLPKAVEHARSDGAKVIVQEGEYTYPFYFRDRKTHLPAFYFQRGCIVVEEYGQASPDVKRALATLILEKRVGDHSLPPGFQIILLTNRATDRSGVGKDFDFIINRRIDLDFTPELEPWLEWAADNDVEPLVMAFANRNQEIVFSGKHPENQGQWCTPRSLVAAGEVIRAFGGVDGVEFTDDKSFLMQMLKGAIGGTALQMMAFLKLRHSLPSIELILNDPDEAPIPSAPDAQMIVVYELAHKVDHRTMQPLGTYIKRLPKAFAVTFVKVVLKRKPDLVSTKFVGDWSRENHQLLAAISR